MMMGGGGCGVDVDSIVAVVEAVKREGMFCGIAIKPATPIDVLWSSFIHFLFFKFI
jgi:pentose-5-phosphate-3-epimerase